MAERTQDGTSGHTCSSLEGAVSTNQSKKARGPLWVKGPENQHLSVARGPGLEVKAVEGSLGNGATGRSRREPHVTVGGDATRL